MGYWGTHNQLLGRVLLIVDGGNWNLRKDRLEFRVLQFLARYLRFDKVVRDILSLRHFAQDFVEIIFLSV
jgi:hypothetical protein